MGRNILIAMKTGELQNDEKLKSGIKPSKTLNSLQNKIFWHA